MNDIKIEEDSAGLSDVPGFVSAGVACDVRGTGDGRLDLALIASKEPCAAAGVFTRNVVKAAPVLLCTELLERGGGEGIRAILVNSGNANACTGPGGVADAKEMARLAEKAIGAPPGSVLVCSTGRIGRPLPMERIENGIREVALQVTEGAGSGKDASRAILTSDTRPKTVTVRFEHEGRVLTVAGMAKGAGMIEPNMATMLAFLGTDLTVPPTLLRDALDRTVPGSYNAITVDGDMSTNDTVLFLSSGGSGVSLSGTGDELHRRFLDAVRLVNERLAEKIVSDGEKITKVVELQITGARNEGEAEMVAREIGNSLLVKSSWYGEDPNWGRLASSAGASGAVFDPDVLDIFYNDVPALQGGDPCPDNVAAWKAIVREKRFTIRINLHAGEGTFRMLATDLSEAYVAFNRTE